MMRTFFWGEVSLEPTHLIGSSVIIKKKENSIVVHHSTISTTLPFLPFYHRHNLWGGSSGTCPLNNWELALHLYIYYTFYQLLPSNILVCPPNIFDKSMPVLSTISNITTSLPYLLLLFDHFWHNHIFFSTVSTISTSMPFLPCYHSFLFTISTTIK